MAARMMDSAEKAGHPISAGNASYFAAKAARGGRRSYYTGRSDVIAPPGYQGQEPDPAKEAARNLDWGAFLASHPPRHRTAILVLVEGGTMREAGKRCGLKDSAAHNLKRRIAADLIAFFGEEVIRRLLDGVRPGWESDLRQVRERHACQVAHESACHVDRSA